MTHSVLSVLIVIVVLGIKVQFRGPRRHSTHAKMGIKGSTVQSTESVIKCLSTVQKGYHCTIQQNQKNAWYRIEPKPCPPNTFSDSPGFVCTQCPAGTRQPKEGQSHCEETPCQNGFYDAGDTDVRRDRTLAFVILVALAFWVLATG